MRKSRLFIFAGLLALMMGLGGASVAAADSTNMLYNPGLEVADGTGAAPMYWTYGFWGTGVTATGTWSMDAHSGTHSARVDITAYPTSTTGGDVGDAKWLPEAVPVTGGAYYAFSDWYKSNRSSAVSVEYWTQGQDPATTDGTWANLFSGIAPASDWTQYQTGFTMPTGAVYATFAHFIYGVGWLETDDYSMTQQPNPPGFSKPMISLTFDDGSAGFYTNAWPLIQADGLKTTQYIPTGTLGSDPDMMTPDQISTLARDGQEIGAHSVTHPYLTTVSDTQLQSELVGSKTALEAIPGVGTVTDFAYPYGDYDARVIAAEQSAGYLTGRSVEEGYNSRLDTQPFDLRVQNILGPTAATSTQPVATTGTTLTDFEGWVNYATAHNYWLVIVFHEVQPDKQPDGTATPPCSNPPADTDPSPCIGPYDTTVSEFTQMLSYLKTSNLDPDVMTVRDAFASASSQMSPTAGAVTITPAQPTTNAMLTATPTGFTDPNGSALSYSYQWLVNGTPITGATGPTFDLSQPGHGDHGDKVEVDVKATNAQGYTSTGVSDVVTVADTSPTSGSVTITPTTPTAGQALTATPSGFADADSDALTYRYTWLENGTPVVGATGATLAAASVVAGTATVEVTALDGYGGVSPVATASVTVGRASGLVADTTPSKITVSSPTSQFYRLGQALVVRFSCSDPSGVAGCMATLGLVGGKPAAVTSGKKVKLANTGRYALRVTATDRAGNTASKRVYFRVTNDGKPPVISIVSPKATSYHTGQMMLVKFSCGDPSGVAGCSATLGQVGKKTTRVTSGKKVLLSASGRYVLRITARDGVGNSGTRVLYFTVK
jgi:peptidoglycan/xylan/chitin deacetylase (PgdA/CDA1 family)